MNFQRKENILKSVPVPVPGAGTGAGAGAPFYEIEAPVPVPVPVPQKKIKAPQHCLSPKLIWYQQSAAPHAGSG